MYCIVTDGYHDSGQRALMIVSRLCYIAILKHYFIWYVFIITMRIWIYVYLCYKRCLNLESWIYHVCIGIHFADKVVLILSFHNPLHWRHNEYVGVSNHQLHGCLFIRLLRRRSKKTSKLRVTGLCAGNSPGTGEFPAQMASYAENVSIWWRHHAPAPLTKSVVSRYLV